MSVLVVGGNGFIGSHVVDSLLISGASVSVLDRYVDRYRAPLERVEYYFGHFGEPEVLNSVFKKDYDSVILLSHPGLSVATPGLIQSDLRNLQDSVTLFEACARNRVKRLVFMSSGGRIYGEGGLTPVTEIAPTNPIGSYGIAKLAIEKHLQSVAWLNQIEWVTLRPSNPYGCRQAPTGSQGALSIFAWAILNGKPITVWGTGMSVRDYLDVESVGSVCAQAALGDAKGVFNLGSGIGHTTLDVIKTLAEVLEIEPNIIMAPARQMDINAIVLDSAKARAKFGFNPIVDLSVGLKSVVVWLKRMMVQHRRRN